MNNEIVIRKLKEAWSDTGFLRRIQKGGFDPVDAQAFLNTLSCMQYDPLDEVDKQVLSVICLLDVFLEIQSHVHKTNELQIFRNNVHNLLICIFGYP